MRTLVFAPVALFTIFVLGAGGDPDTVIIRKTHTDAFMMRDRETPARDATITTWMRGKDKLRIEEGDQVTIVLAGEKKVHLLNTKDKTASTVELPFDMKKYMPESAPAGGGREGRGGDGARADGGGAPAVTVTPTEETRKISNWTAKKYKVSRSGGFNTTTEEVWAVADAGFELAAFRELTSQIPSMRPAPAANDEMKKIEGFVILIERTRQMGDADVKSREEIVSIEKKEAPEGAFEIPKDYQIKPFEPRMLGGGGRGGMGRGPREGGEGASSRSGRQVGGGGTASKPAAPPEK
ncbi:MAG: DUF4412 domain-containing protein [Planctomycetota bacterium]